ncbi:MAG: TIGR00269 family protein [Candidatus Thorarchaeota archaeon]
MVLQCSKCGQPAIYLRRYTSEALCAACLIRTTEQRVRRTINKRKMLRDDDRIAVAVSGGKDSAVLLDVMVRIERDFPKAELIPFTIDEGITGYRDLALKAAHRLANSLDLDLHVWTFRDLFGFTLDSIVQGRGQNDIGACSYCGVLRRRAINDAARELDADVVVTGHNLDDEAQTILMNMMRGDARRIARTNRLRELAVEGFVPRAKPLMEVSERDIVAYAHFAGLPYHDMPCPYAVEAYRNDIRDFLNRMEHKRPGTLLALLHSAETVAGALHSSLKGIQHSVCVRCGAPTTGQVCKTCQLIERIANR